MGRVEATEQEREKSVSRIATTRFSLKSGMLAVLCLAVAIWAIPNLLYQWQVREVSSQLDRWLENQYVDTPTYQSCCIIPYGGTSFYVSRSQQEYDSEKDEWIYMESKNPNGALYVAPPGVWCESRDAAIRCIWRTSRASPDQRILDGQVDGWEYAQQMPAP